MPLRAASSLGALVLLATCAIATSARADDVACAAARDRSAAEESAGKLQSARVSAAACAIDECPEEVAKACYAAVTRLTDAIGSLTVAVVDPQGAAIPGAKITIDGNVVAPGETVMADPGPYLIKVEAPDGTQVVKELVVAQGEKKRESVTVLLGGGAKAGPAGLTGHVAPPPIDNGEPAPPAHVLNQSSYRLYRGLGTAGAVTGFLGVTLGAYFGLLAIARRDEAGCSNGLCSSQATLDTYRSAHGAATASTVLFLTGGALAGGGLLLWFNASSLAMVAPPTIDAHKIQIAPSVGVAGGPGGGMLIRGSF